MKKILIVFIVFSCLFLCCSCNVREEKDVFRVRILCSDREERDKMLGEISIFLAGAEDKEECVRRMRERGYECEEEYYQGKFYDGRYFAAGYYTTVRVGEGTQGWQYVAYPSYLYQSLEEFNNEEYRSFFYEIVKKMEERN